MRGPAPAAVKYTFFTSKRNGVIAARQIDRYKNRIGLQGRYILRLLRAARKGRVDRILAFWHCQASKHC